MVAISRHPSTGASLPAVLVVGYLLLYPLANNTGTVGADPRYLYPMLPALALLIAGLVPSPRWLPSSVVVLVVAGLAAASTSWGMVGLDEVRTLDVRFLEAPGTSRVIDLLEDRDVRFAVTDLAGTQITYETGGRVKASSFAVPRFDDLECLMLVEQPSTYVLDNNLANNVANLEWYLATNEIPYTKQQIGTWTVVFAEEWVPPWEAGLGMLLGVVREPDPDLIIPDRGLSLAEGAVVPWTKVSKSQQRYFADLLESLAAHMHFSTAAPVRELSPEALATTLASVAMEAPQLYTGSGDHLVSQAFYLDDPEGNGVELYWDRPRTEWQWRDGQVQMATLFVDPNAFIGEHLGTAARNFLETDPDRRVRPDQGDQVVGHVHLKVGNADQAKAFYVGLLGFDVTAEMTGAVFVSAGGYHHHMAMNTWASAGVGMRTPALGLGIVDIALPDAQDVAAAAARLRAGGVAVRDDGAAIEADDPWGNLVRLSA